jgi:tetratricopeptide (TPR) repeat protein
MIWCFVGTLIAQAETQGQLKDIKKPVNPYVLQLDSTIDDLVITRDGIVAGKSKSAMDATYGWNQLAISKQGYYSRKVRFWLERPGFYVKRVELIPKPIKSVKDRKKKLEIPPIKKEPGKREQGLVSICQKASPGTEGDTLCHRHSFWEDVMFSGGIWEDSRLYEKLPVETQMALMQRSFLLGVAEKSSLYFLEELSYANPTHPGIITALAKEYFFHRECVNFSRLAAEALQINMPLSELMTYAALCYEAIDMRDAAIQFLEKHAVAENEHPLLSYHFGRILMPDYPKDAERVIEKCREKFPGYYPCFEMQKIIAAVDHKVKTANEREYVAAVSEDIKNQFEKINKSNHPLDEVQRALFERRLSYELLWQELVLQRRAGKMVPISIVKERLRFARVANKTVANEVLQSVKELGDKEWYQLALAPLTLAFPEHSYYWMELVKLYEQSKQCDQVIETVQSGARFVNENSQRVLQTRRGQCLVELGRYREAVALYQELAQAFPKNWLIHYNLGAVYERLGQKQMALQSFKEALKNDPPADRHSLIGEKVKLFSGSP